MAISPRHCSPRCMGSVGASGGKSRIPFLVITVGDAGGGLPGNGAKERESGPPAADREGKDPPGADTQSAMIGCGVIENRGSTD